MKFLWILLLAAGPFVLADDDSDGSASAIEGRTRNSGNTGGNSQQNTRFLGGGGLGGGLGSLLGIGQALVGGVLGSLGNPNFGGGINPGFRPGVGGGFGPGFGGGFNQGFGGGFNQGFQGGCRFSCRAPNGQFVCCGSSPFGGSKPGQCPPIRPSCPPTRNFAPPQTCFVDHQCAGVDKCCFDTCLRERVCKPPSGIGGFGR